MLFYTNPKAFKSYLIPHMMTSLLGSRVTADFLSNLVFQAQKLYAFLGC